MQNQALLEAEEAVLASCIIEPTEMRKIVDCITPEHFQKIHNKYIWEILSQKYIDEPSMNILALKKYLDVNKLSSVGGISYIVSLLDLPIGAFHCEDYYAKVLHDAYLQKKIQRLALMISETPENEKINILNEIKKIEQSRNIKTEITEMPQALQEFNDIIDDMYCGKIKTFKTGFNRLDSVMGGLPIGSLFVIGARTSQGKSAFLIQSTMSFLKAGLRVLYLSCEMTKYDIFCRIMSLETNESLWRFRNNPSKELIETTVGIQKDIVNFHFGVFVENNMTLSAISALCNTFKPNVLIVDYIQSFRTISQNRAAHFSNVANDLKLLAIQNNIVVMTASQLSRNIVFREDKTPTLADLKESGGIEEAADVVVLLHIKSRNPEIKTRNGEFIIDKNRNGACGYVPFVFQEECARFIEP